MTKEVTGVAFAIGPGLPPSLKQQLLLVDRVGAVNLDKVDVSLEGLTRTWPHEPADIVALRDEGILFHIDSSLPADLLAHQEAGPALQAALEATRKSDELSDQIPHHISWEDAPAAFELLHASRDQVMISRSHLARAIAVHLRQTRNVDAVSLLPIEESRAVVASRDAVFRIVLAELPLPSDSVPFREIAEFRRSSDIRERLHGIRVWANKIARERLSGFEIEEEFAYLRAQYENSFRQLQQTTATGVLEILVPTLFEVIEHVGNLNFGSAARALFSIGRERMNLLKEERSLPGHEIGYVAKAKNHFPEPDA